MKTPDDVCGANCTLALDWSRVLVGLTSLGASHCFQPTGGSLNPSYIFDCQVVVNTMSSHPHGLSNFLSLFIIIDSLYILDGFTLNPRVSIVRHEEH
jgi:hypothetical protein